MSYCLRRWFVAFALLAAIGIAAGPARAQGTTGQISGEVLDSQGLSIPGATVSVRNQATQTTREVVTDIDGIFTITNILAGTYDLRVTMTGFRTVEQTGIVLTATERLSLPAIELAVGGLEETIQVTATADRVQTTSGERSAVISANELADRGLKGRDPLGTLMTLPGIVDTSNRDAPGSTGGLSINGQTSIAFAYDGITSKDTGSNGGNFARPALDSIAEIKVQASNFQAEYGRSSGATIVVVTKSGSSQFRGSAAYFRRDDAFNSNTWERKRDCDAGQAASCQPPPYKYNNTTYTLGGPVLLPGTDYNANRDKLFFFWSHDMLPRRDPGNLSQLTMPTALERAGDFSQTFDSQGRLRFIRDPQASGSCSVNTGGSGCFANNVIPTNRISPYAATLLSQLPMPNTVDPTGRRQYNYTYQNQEEKPRYDHTLRVDWNIGPQTTFYSRFQFGSNTVAKGYSSSLGSSGNGGWQQFLSSRHDTTESMVNTLLHTFDAATVLEVTFGINWADQNTYAENQGGLDSPGSLARNQRSTGMPGLPPMVFGGGGNPYDIIPNVTWAGSNALPGTPSYSFESRYPFTARDDTHDLSVNLTKLWGSHNVKFGSFYEFVQRPASRSSNFNGTFSFNAASDNPLDSNFGLANLMLGNLNSYTESDLHPYAQGRFRQFEFFVQDNWRVRRNFTLDYGVRFYHIGPTYVDNQDIAIFSPDAYNSAGAVQLYTAGCRNGAALCSGSNRQAVNPDGGFLPSLYIGKVIPGSGDLTNGMVIMSETPYDAVFLPAPRVTFAWDVTGDGKTAVRGGAGIFYDRYGDDTVLRLIEPKPLVDTRTYNYVNMAELTSAAPVNSLITNARAFVDKFTAPTVYNWSLGVQRELPWNMVGDVAYVGNAGRHTSGNVNLNGLDYGTRRLDLHPEAADPTRNGTQAKDDFYFRPYVGYSNIQAQIWKGENNYHSIQVSVTRRAGADGLGWGVSYTGARRTSLTTFDPFLTEDQNRQRNESKSGSRPHNLVINYNYRVPALSGVWDNWLVRGLADGWQLNGVSTFQSGTYTSFTYGFSPSRADDVLTGGPGGSRVTMVCDPNLPRGDRTETRQFRTECIQMPGPTTASQASGGFLVDPTDMFFLGNSLGDERHNLGYVNHDLALFKNFAMSSRRNLQIRVEFYNLFNSVQWSGVDSSATFNPTTGEQTDTNFGTVTGTRNGSARVIQLGARFTF